MTRHSPYEAVIVQMIWGGIEQVLEAGEEEGRPMGHSPYEAATVQIIWGGIEQVLEAGEEEG